MKSRTIRFAWIRGRSRPRPLATSANFHDGWQHACRTAEDTDQGPLIRATREHSLERVDYSLVAQRGVSVDGPPPVCSLDDPPLCCIVDGTVRCVKKTLSALRRYVASWTVLYGASRKRFLQKSTFLDVVRDADTSNDDVPRNLFKTLSVFHQPSRHEYYYLAAQSRSLSRVLRRGPLDTHANNESIRGAQSVRQHWQPPVRAPVPPLTETRNGRNARSTTDWSGFRTHAWRHWYWGATRKRFLPSAAMLHRGRYCTILILPKGQTRKAKRGTQRAQIILLEFITFARPVWSARAGVRHKGKDS